MSELFLHGDCMVHLSSMPDKSVDLVFYDPPYNVKKKYDGYSDNRKPEEYLQWMSDVYAQSERVSRRGVVVYVGSKLVRTFTKILPETAHLIVVEKRAAGVFAGNYMLQYHAMFSTAKPTIKCKDLWNDVRLPGEGYYFREPRYDHPGLTGLEFTKKALHHFSLEGDTILDPFSGVGTTAVASKLMGRDFIGIEQSRKYIKVAMSRLGEIK